MRHVCKFFAIIAMASTLWSPGANAQGVPLAAGHANTEFMEDLRAISFVAVELRDGTVVGQLQAFLRAVDYRAHVEIDCAAAGWDNSLVLGGVLTHQAFFFRPLGSHLIFAVRDGGEGKNAVDEITGFLFYYLPPGEEYPVDWCVDAVAQSGCLQSPDHPLCGFWQIDGNVQVF